MRLLSPPDAHSGTRRNAARARACSCARTDEAPAASHSFGGQVELMCTAIGNECVLLYQHNKRGTRLILKYSYIKEKPDGKMNKQKAQSQCHRRRIGFELWNSRLHHSPGSPCCCLQLCPPALELTPAQLCFSRPGWRVGACSQLPANTLLGALSFAGSWRGQCQPHFRLDYLDLPACRVKSRTLRAGPLRPSAVFLFAPCLKMTLDPNDYCGTSFFFIFQIFKFPNHFFLCCCDKKFRKKLNILWKKKTFVIFFLRLLLRCPPSPSPSCLFLHFTLSYEPGCQVLNSI